MTAPRFLVFVPAYEASATIESVVRKVMASVHDTIAEILVQDDASRDDTYALANALRAHHSRLRVVRNDRNLGYGGTKKKAYRYALDRGFDGVVMLHGDAQHPPELLGRVLEPIASGHADVVLGSRMLRSPRREGMPLYKAVGNRALTRLLNWYLGLRLTDFHTGFRAYSAHALRKLEIDTLPDGHEISAQILIRAGRGGLRIAEVPIPAIYPPESRSIRLLGSIRYGLRVLEMIKLSRSAPGPSE